ncbi:MAG: hypothetical protein DRQ55_10860 [Planctomycetota bacterium]|nr:MAG: hypothetical protein DRQ55_10860 [Planctomycetota bacterium]
MAALCVLLSLLAMLAAAPAAQPTPLDPRAVAPAGDPAGDPARVELATAEWTRNGEPDAELARQNGDPPVVHLPYDAQGVRWATTFSTDEAASFRLYLDWSPAEDGLLIEVMLDGERLSPARDGWRPSSRRLISDLGPRWLGRGGHLLEFIAREQPVDVARVHLTALELREP